ncbi:MAG: hypothetical protein M0Q92_10285 [Methanoregula sp.]|nr:hypothetical protein [Methanoregula sp.]
MMKKSLVLILAGILCVMLAASGCTGSSPATSATPAATSAAPAESVTKETAAAIPAPEAPSWAGTWNSTWLEKDGNKTISVLTLTQAGPEVSGNYRFTYPEEGTYTGSLNATVQGSTLTGTYAESDDDVGFFVFELSENKNSFTGRWVHAENKSELAGSTLSWNGVRE